MRHIQRSILLLIYLMVLFAPYVEVKEMEVEDVRSDLVEMWLTITL